MALTPGAIIDPWYDMSERSKVRIMSRGIGGVTGLVPESFGFSWSNSYRQPFGDILASFNTGVQIGQELGNKLAGRRGEVDWTATLQELKRQIWTGSSSIAFNLNLLYIARRGTTLDVVNPIRRLTAFGAPRTAVRVTTGKGEAAFSATVVNSPPIVQIEIGFMLRLKKAVIKTVNVAFPTNVTDVAGQPNEALVSLGIESDRMFLSDDTEVDFIGSQVNRWVGGL
jgi:hypothetical protein